MFPVACVADLTDAGASFAYGACTVAPHGYRNALVLAPTQTIMLSTG